MSVYSVPYGNTQMSFSLPGGVHTEIIEPVEVPAAADPLGAVEEALDRPVGGVSLASFQSVRTVAIAINDRTRPIPYAHLLPPLLRKLESLGLRPESIRLFIAAGTHAPMLPEEYHSVVPEDVLSRYSVLCHDADDLGNLLYLGTTSRRTPIWANRLFVEADLKIVVGNLEPHQFQGFSGGVKGAAIGLAGRKTIDANHSLMLDPNARLGCYADNPARQDVEEIGRRLGVAFALNAILNGGKKIIHAIAGEPRAVMEAGIPSCLRLCQVPVGDRFDLVVASPGGHPRDLNLYQSQKAFAHACQVTKGGGVVILVAACPEGPGSKGYQDWLVGKRSVGEVLASFEGEGFRVGPHKAYLLARDAKHVRLVLVSDMNPHQVERLLLTPAASVDAAIGHVLPEWTSDSRIGIMPRASSTIPYVAS